MEWDEASNVEEMWEQVKWSMGESIREVREEEPKECIVEWCNWILVERNRRKVLEAMDILEQKGGKWITWKINQDVDRNIKFLEGNS